MEPELAGVLNGPTPVESYIGESNHSSMGPVGVSLIFNLEWNQTVGVLVGVSPNQHDH